MVALNVPNIPPPVKQTIVLKNSNQANQANVALGEILASQAGITGAEWQCLYQLGMRESGWSDTAINKTSGAGGIPQALPFTKILGDRTDPATQILWMINYIFGRYGTSCNALQHSLTYSWY